MTAGGRYIKSRLQQTGRPLSDRQRATLRHLEGLGYNARQIGAFLGVSDTTVRRYLDTPQHGNRGKHLSSERVTFSGTATHQNLPVDVFMRLNGGAQ